MNDFGEVREEFRGFFVNRPTEIPINVSCVYYELYDYVQKSHATVAEATRQVIFAVAYSLYCLDKKESIYNYSKNGKKPGSDVFKSVHISLSDTNKYKDYCDRAGNILTHSLKEARAIYASDLQNRLDKVVQDIKATTDNSLQEINRNIAVFNKDVKSSSAYMERRDRWTLRSHLKDMVMHVSVAISVVIVVSVIFAVIGYLIDTFPSWKPYFIWFVDQVKHALHVPE